MDRLIKIGTRDSPLAMWQARLVQDKLSAIGIPSEIVAVKSEGDLDLVTPLYAMGVQGVFTKTLDAYLLSHKIDIAVHSMKDVPVQLAQGIVSCAVLERAMTQDLIVWKNENVSEETLKQQVCTIGTGSIRRKSQWLHRYPHHQIDNLRGNVQTRLAKLEASNWVGAVFAAAGLNRMEIDSYKMSSLDWMIPAPAQGAIMVVCREDDSTIFEQVHPLNHALTQQAVDAERTVLRLLHGGCSAPIGVHVFPKHNQWCIEACVASLDGTEYVEVRDVYSEWDNTIGERTAEKLISMGVVNIVDNIRN